MRTTLSSNRKVELNQECNEDSKDAKLRIKSHRFDHFEHAAQVRRKTVIVANRLDALQLNGVVSVDKEGRRALIVPKDHLEEIRAMILSDNAAQYFLLIHNESASELEIQSHPDKESWRQALRECGASDVAQMTAEISHVTKEAQLACIEDMLDGRIRSCSPYADALY